MKKFKVGLLGYGNIGQGVWEIVNKKQEKIENDIGAQVDITGILVRNKEKYTSKLAPSNIFTTDANVILENPDIDIVIELIGGVYPAYEYIKTAIQNGKHVVTANKAVISLHGVELFRLADEVGVSLMFEGSVAGGIPIVGALRRSFMADEITEIVGILNGTTNYILTRMSKEGLPFKDALFLAQQKGYAEADPTSDIEGEDAVFKLAILANIAFGVQVLPADISREGITKISDIDINYAKELGYTIKLVAKAKNLGDSLELHVHPSLIPEDHPLAAVSNEYNALYVTGESVGQLMFYGKGAGSFPTGSAVANDLLTIIKSEQKESNRRFLSSNIGLVKAAGETECEYYIRLQVKDYPGVLGDIAAIFGNYSISLASVVQKAKGDSIVPLVFITHKASRKSLNKALDDIRLLNETKEIASILRVENLY